MNTPKISMIAIISKNRGLGKDNKLLFHIPGELKRFKEITMGGANSPVGHALIMGRKTFESLNRPHGLPGRLNIILSNNTALQEDGVIRDKHTPLYFIPDWEEAINLVKEWELKQHPNEPEIFIIGGGQIYEQAMPFVDRLYLTLVDKEADADTFFPEYESSFTKNVKEPEVHKTEEFKYTFLTLEK